MSPCTPRERTLKLEDIRRLFVAPARDPFSAGGMAKPGIETLLDSLGSGPPRGGDSVRIELPPGKLEEARRMDPAGAVRRYCRSRIEECEGELAAMRRDGRRALWIGFGMITVCLTLAAAAGEASWMPRFGKVCAESLTVLGWVSIWHPAEMLLFDRWPLRRAIRALAVLEKAEISLVARGEG